MMISIGDDITERIRAEELLKKSEEKYRVLVDESPDLRYRTDTEGVIIYISESVQKLTGYTAAEVIGMKMSSMYLHPDERNVLLDALRQKGFVNSFVAQVKSKDGSIWWASSNVRYYKDDEGTILGVDGVTRDITDRKLAEERLELFRCQVDKSNDAIFVIDALTGRIQDVNHKACESLQYGRSELCHMLLSDIEMKFSNDSFLQEHLQHIKKHEKLLMEGMHRRQDGTMFPVEVNVSYIQLANKEFMVAVARDVTERKKAEKTLRESKNFWSNIIDQSPFSTWIADANGTNIRQNAACRKLFGIGSDNQTVGKYNFFKDPLNKTHGHLEEIEKVFTKGKTARFTIDYDFSLVDHVAVPHGTHTVLKVTIFPIKDEGGRVVNAVVQHEDITRRMQAEEKLLLTMQQLREANAELEQFSYVAAHDLKAPVRAMSNYASFLQEDLESTLTGEQKKYLTRLKSTAVEANRMIEDLLVLARIGKDELNPENIQLGDFLDNLLKSMDLGLDTKVDLSSDLPAVTCDPLLLRQVFQNLIDNGVKYTTASPKSIEIGSLPETEGVITCYVRDNGIGIDAAYHDQIFGLFERLHSSKEYSGTGVGLAIVKKTLNKLGGTIRLESTVGKGSTFYISLPANVTK